MQNTFSEKLREQIELKGKTQNEVAKGIGVSQPTISFWLAGKKQPTAEYVLLVANYFNVSTDYLLGKEK